MPINFAIKLAATVAMEALQMGLQASKKTTGPRLDELTVTVADFGTPLPRFLGARKFACPVFHAEDLKEVEHSTKIKGGGKQTSFSYLATFACAIADNAIDQVLRIWFDDQLVYDATGAGPMSYAQSLGVNLDAVMRIYKGTEAQDPDPRYASWCEDRYGPDSAPAYRGVSYLFFEELPVDNFGNRIPQISVLVTSAANGALPYEQLTDPGGSYLNQPEISSTGDWYIRYASAHIEWWDVATRTYLGTSSGPSGYEDGNLTNIDLASDGTAYWIDQFDSGGSAFSALYTCSPLGSILRSVATDAPWFSGPTRVFDTADGRFIYSGVPNDHTGYCSNGGHVADTLCGCDFALKSDGIVYGLFEPTGSSSQVVIAPLSGSGTAVTFNGTTRSTPNSPTFCHVASQHHWFVVTDGHWYTVDDAIGAIKASGTFSGWTNNLPRKRPNVDSFYSGYSEISLVDGSVIRTLNSSDWVAEDSGTGETAYSPSLNGLIVHPQFASHITIRYLDRAGNGGTTLGAIVSKMCDAAGLNDRDTTALTQTVAGYSWTRGDVKSQMEPVLDIHDVDARPHDFTVEFKPRGSSPVGSILTQDFATTGQDAPRYKVTIAQDTDLPAMLRVNFADTGFDQQTNNVLSPLPLDSVDTKRDDTIDLTTYAATPTEAQQLADRYMRRRWNSRETIENSLTAQCFALEPGDVTTLDLDGIAQNVMLNKQTISGGRSDWTSVRDETSFAAVNSATTGPAMEARDTGTITMPAPIRAFVIDAPYREDADADVRPLLYSGAGAYAGLSFPRAAIYEATGAGSSLAFDSLFATVSTGATWGLCTTTLANVPSPWLWDRGNTLTIALQNGSLTSVAEADINADPTLNLILVGSTVGWEYVNFTTATLNGDGTWTLSGFKRGRRGTEWSCGLHTSSEVVVLASSIAADEMGADDLGTAMQFKAQALGRSLDIAPIIGLTYAGNTLKPYAPAGIEWTTDGTDMFGTIVRRTRVGGAWVGGSTIPLSEASEAYSVDIYRAGVLKRTIAVTGTNLFTYTSAQITADGNTLGVPPAVHAYQISDVVGRGFALAA